LYLHLYTEARQRLLNLARIVIELYMYMRTEVIVTSCGLVILRKLYTVLSSALCIDNRMHDNDLPLNAYLSIVGVILLATLRLGRRSIA